MRYIKSCQWFKTMVEQPLNPSEFSKYEDCLTLSIKKDMQMQVRLNSYKAINKKRDLKFEITFIYFLQ